MKRLRHPRRLAARRLHDVGPDYAEPQLARSRPTISKHPASGTVRARPLVAGLRRRPADQRSSNGRLPATSTSNWRPPESAKRAPWSASQAPAPRRRSRPRLRSTASGSARMPSPFRPARAAAAASAFSACPGEEFTTFRVGFDASWELDLFGRNRREREAATAPHRRRRLEPARCRSDRRRRSRRRLSPLAHLPGPNGQCRGGTGPPAAVRTAGRRPRHAAGWSPARTLSSRSPNAPPPRQQFRFSRPRRRRKSMRLAC